MPLQAHVPLLPRPEKPDFHEAPIQKKIPPERPGQRPGKLTNLISSIGIGELLAICSAFTFATSQILIRLGMRTASPIAAAFIINGVVSLSGFAVSSYKGTLFTSSLVPILWFMAGGLTGPGIGRISYLTSIPRMGLSRSVTITSSTPLWSTLIAVAILGETPSGWVVFGTIGIVLGVSVLSLREDPSQTFKSWLSTRIINGCSINSNCPPVSLFYITTSMIYISIIITIIYKCSFSSITTTCTKTISIVSSNCIWI